MNKSDIEERLMVAITEQQAGQSKTHKAFDDMLQLIEELRNEVDKRDKDAYTDKEKEMIVRALVLAGQKGQGFYYAKERQKANNLADRIHDTIRRAAAGERPADDIGKLSPINSR